MIVLHKYSESTLQMCLLEMPRFPRVPLPMMAQPDSRECSLITACSRSLANNHCHIYILYVYIYIPLYTYINIMYIYIPILYYYVYIYICICCFSTRSPENLVFGRLPVQQQRFIYSPYITYTPLLYLERPAVSATRFNSEVPSKSNEPYSQAHQMSHCTSLTCYRMFHHLTEQKTKQQSSGEMRNAGCT